MESKADPISRRTPGDVTPRAVFCVVCAVITGNEWLRRALAQTCGAHLRITLSCPEKCWCVNIHFPLPAFTTSSRCRWTKGWTAVFRWHICCSPCFLHHKTFSFRIILLPRLLSTVISIAQPPFFLSHERLVSALPCKLSSFSMWG